MQETEIKVYVYSVMLRHERQGFNKRVSVQASDVWRAVEGAFEDVGAKGYDADDFAVVELRRGTTVA